MTAAQNSLYISAASIFLSIAVIAIDVSLIVKFILGKQTACLKHFSMLVVKMAFDSCFALATIVYSTSVILNVLGVMDNSHLLYPSGNVVQSMEASMSILNVFIALDRLFAMRTPLLYSKQYGARIQKLTIVLVLATFLACFGAYTVTRPEEPNRQLYLFTHLVDKLVQSVIHLTTIGILVIGLVVTVFFLVDFRKFATKRRTNNVMVCYAKSVNKVNRIVLYLMAVELLCLVIPNVLEIVLRHWFCIFLHSNFGPVIHPLFVLYIAISSVLFLCSVATKAKAPHTAIVHTTSVPLFQSQIKMF